MEKDKGKDQSKEVRNKVLRKDRIDIRNKSFNERQRHTYAHLHLQVYRTILMSASQPLYACRHLLVVLIMISLTF